MNMVTLPDVAPQNGAVRHTLSALIDSLVAARMNVYLVGPAGSGKTALAQHAAQAASLPFYAQSVGQQTTVTHLMGYMTADGSYVPSAFRRAYEAGGVFLIDEIDAGNANVFTVINSALSNDYCAFPDRMVHRHEDFVCIAAANTYGSGATVQYVGRNSLDAATLDRFVFVPVGYDTALEAVLTRHVDWHDNVLLIREAVQELRLQIIVSMRAAVNGARLLYLGLPWKEVEDMTIWKGLERSIVEKVKHLVEQKKSDRPRPPNPQPAYERGFSEGGSESFSGAAFDWPQDTPKPDEEDEPDEEPEEEPEEETEKEDSEAWYNRGWPEESDEEPEDEGQEGDEEEEGDESESGEPSSDAGGIGSSSDNDEDGREEDGAGSDGHEDDPVNARNSATPPSEERNLKGPGIPEDDTMRFIQGVVKAVQEPVIPRLRVEERCDI